MVWSSILGHFIFWIGLLIAIILYISKRKWYPIGYLISISLYFFTVAFFIDVFNFSKNNILLTLAFSSILMIGTGIYLSKKFHK
jgi:hypothetical protein